MQGRDLSPIYLAEERLPWRSDFFYEHPTIRNINFIPSSQALVSKDWKYIYWPDHHTEQLFNRRIDPREENDLLDDPSQAERLAEMRDRNSKLKSNPQWLM